jgi:DNA-binding SARP family transcriptional activator
MKAAAWLAWLSLDSDRTESDRWLAEARRITAEQGYDRFWDNDFAGFADALLGRAPAAIAAAPASPPEEGLVIHTLGRFELLRDGQAVAAANGRVQAMTLLKLLISSPRQSLLKDQIAESLWPDAQRQGSNIRMVVLKLRDFLKPDRGSGDEAWVIAEGDGYRLAWQGVMKIDSLLFEEELARGESAHRQGDLDAAREAYKRAAAQYKGEYLPEDLYEPWAERRRESLREAWAGCLTRIGDLEMRLGEAASALHWYARIFEDDPSNEIVFQKMLKCYIQLGDRTEALRQYERFRKRLSTDLELQPGTQTEALVRDIRESALRD